MTSLALSGSTPAAERRHRLLEAFFVLAGAIGVTAFVLLPQIGVLAVIGCVGLCSAGIIANALCGRLDGMLLWWCAVFPLGYYFVAFPREQAVVTLDRLVVFAAFIGLLFAGRGAFVAVPDSLRRAAFAWLAFAAVALITVHNSANALNAARAITDSFVLPLSLGWCVLARFDVRGRLATLHAAVCVSSIISAVIAAAEIVLQQDLLPIGVAARPFAGIIRPNGPFESNDSLSLIGAVSFFFLLFLRSAVSQGPGLTPRRKVLHFCGLAGALGMALMPLFRSVALTLFLILILDTLWERRTARRAWRLLLIVASVCVIFVLAAFAPQIFEDRSSAGNVYGRVAQFDQSLRVFAEHPLTGVGFLNFHGFVTGEPRYVATYAGVSSLDWPHDNLLQVLTETGIIGFVPYVMAQIFLFAAIWQLRRYSSDGRLICKYCIYLFLSYWITGLSESSGYGPLNLWYVFVIAVIYKYVLTELRPLPSSQDEDVLDGHPAAPPPSLNHPALS